MSMRPAFRLGSLVLASAAVLAPTAGLTADPSPATSARPFDTSSLGATFDVPLTLTLDADWRALTGVIHNIDLVHVGDPPEDQSQWWGPSISLVDGARVHDPADPYWDEAFAGSDWAMPWPDDFAAYVLSLPDVEVVEGPDEVTIGGAPGTAIVVEGPHFPPLIWLADDTTWLGGGGPGTRELILLDVGGRKVLLHYGEGSAATFDERRPLVDALWDGLSFPGTAESD